MNFIATGIGAGLVSALLTVVVVKATPLAAVLYLLAPIPVLIVSLGWSHRSGLVATFVGGLAIAAFVSPLSGLGFAVITGLPAWWLAYLALLGRPGPDGTMEWYPVGRLLGWTAATAALTIVAIGFISAGGDYETFHSNSRRIAEAFISLIAPPLPDQAGELAVQREASIERITAFTPSLSALGFTLFLSFYLWTAGKVVSVSKRLPRPWPSVPEMAMPRSVLLVLLLAGALTLVGGFIGVLGYALIGAFLMAFALQGLAAIHERTRGKTGRGFLLAGLYVLLFMTQGLMIVALSLFGLTDTIFGLRNRFGSNRPKQPPTLST
jgi:hypothetical protein